MDKTDFTSMKSGFDPLQAPVDDDFKKNTTAIVVAYGTEALKTAAKYVSHSGRNVVTPEDIKRSMMLEMFLFNKRPNLLETAAEIKNEIYGDVDLDDDEEIENMIIDNDEELEDEFEESECDCAMCKCLNTIYSRWDTFEPQTLFETVFKKHIENIN